MQTFDYKEKTYITINGKDYFLIRGYCDGSHWKERWFFIQVYGKTPLHPEDLPDDTWEIIKTRAKEGSIFTAYKPKFFDYHLIKEENNDYKKVYFIGMNPEGSLYLALSFLSKLYRIKVSDQTMKDIIQRLQNGKRNIYSREIGKIGDHGNSKTPIYCIEFDRWKMNREEVERIFQIGKGE